MNEPTKCPCCELPDGLHLGTCAAQKDAEIASLRLQLAEANKRYEDLTKFHAERLADEHKRAESAERELRRAQAQINKMDVAVKKAQGDYMGANKALERAQEALRKIIAICGPSPKGRFRRLDKIFGELMDIANQALHPEIYAVAGYAKGQVER